MLRMMPRIFCGCFALRIMLFIIFTVQVLAVERRTPSSKTGQQQQNQQWYEKGWQQSQTDSKSDTIFIDDAHSRPKYDGGSGDGRVDDLDNNASGYGPDDEDAARGGDRGSGDSGDNLVVDSGSGDVELPPTSSAGSHVNTSETASSTTDQEPITSVASWSSTSVMDATSTTSSTSMPKSTTALTPSIVPVVTTAAATTPRTTSSHRIIVTTTATRSATSTTLLMHRPTTTEPIRKRPTTTTVGSIATTTSREIHKTSPKVPPPMFDDANRTQNFWMRPGVLAGLIGGAVAGLLAAILLVMFVVYRMKKKDEGSYALEEPKSPPAYAYAYQKAPTREFYA